MRKALIIISVFVGAAIITQSCSRTKPACGTKKEKAKKMKALQKNGTFKM